MANGWLGLEGKVAVVTGAAGGMGKEICRELAKQEVKIGALDFNKEYLDAFVKELKDDFNADVTPLVVDQTNEEQVDQAVKTMKETYGRVDIVINTAAVLRGCLFEELPLDEFKQTMDINVGGYFLVSQRFGRLMIEQGKGTMVHISTIASQIPETYSAAYSMTKAAVNMLSRQMAAEWGRLGIRSNCIMPALVKTPMSASFYADPEVENGRKRLTASKRIGTTMDIANAVLFLASDRSDYINGAEIPVEGGIRLMMQDMIPKPGGRRAFAKEQHDRYMEQKAQKNKYPQKRSVCESTNNFIQLPFLSVEVTNHLSSIQESK
ncbi:MAG: SDR family oxidoreductase [Aerococcus sp.]|nr:SDR family oxidoreductase [Aerococcus sp.]